MVTGTKCNSEIDSQDCYWEKTQIVSVSIFGPLYLTHQILLLKWHGNRQINNDVNSLGHVVSLLSPLPPPLSPLLLCLSLSRSTSCFFFTSSLFVSLLPLLTIPPTSAWFVSVCWGDLQLQNESHGELWGKKRQWVREKISENWAHHLLHSLVDWVFIEIRIWYHVLSWRCESVHRIWGKIFCHLSLFLSSLSLSIQGLSFPFGFHQATVCRTQPTVLSEVIYFRVSRRFRFVTITPTF